MKPFTSKHCAPINYGSPLSQNKEKTYGPSQGGITKSVISTKIGPKENKGYTIENTTPKGLYTSDAKGMTIKATSKKLPKGLYTSDAKGMMITATSKKLPKK